MLSNKNKGGSVLGEVGIAQRLAGHESSGWRWWLPLHCVFWCWVFFSSNSLHLLNYVYLNLGVYSLLLFLFSPPPTSGAGVSKRLCSAQLLARVSPPYPFIHRHHFRERWQLSIRLDEQLSDRGGYFFSFFHKSEPFIIDSKFISMIHVFVVQVPSYC